MLKYKASLEAVNKLNTLKALADVKYAAKFEK